MIPHEPPQAPSVSLWIGTYAGGGGAGVYPLQGAQSGQDAAGLSVGMPCADAANASFGAYSSRFDLHYLVDEQDDGALGIYRPGETALTLVGRVATGGAAPCHVALDAAQSCVAIANYASGSVALYRLDAGGMPIVPPSVDANTGSGPNAERQQSPHAHWVGFGLDNCTLYATDLGTDQVLAFAVDLEHGTLGTPHTAFAAPPGSGPRHLLFDARHRRTAYLACELTSMLIVLDVEDGMLRHRAALSTLPVDCTEANIVAHIAANAAGDRLYVSNRGHDSIAVFALDDQGDGRGDDGGEGRGKVTPIQHIASGGASPRFFLISEDERRMIVVHERDHRVTVLDILPDGTLAPTDLAVEIPGAAFAFSSRSRSAM